MKFKFKALLASLALVAALPANAAISLSSTGDSSLVLTLIDATANVSATFDLGFNKSSFVQTTNQTFNITTGDYAAAWTSFVAAADMSRVQYAVFAADNTGSGAGARSLFTTGSTDPLTSVGTTAFGTSLGSFDTYLNANNQLSTNFSAANGGSFASSSAGLANANDAAAYGGDGGKIGSFGADTNGLVGTNLNVYNILSGSTGLAQTSVTKLVIDGFNPYFNLTSAGELSYVAAVPEVDTSAMMLAGVGFMAFIARRRKAV
jgi:hypothetical protein